MLGVTNDVICFLHTSSIKRRYKQGGMEEHWRGEEAAAVTKSDRSLRSYLSVVTRSCFGGWGKS
jgi:hypothetical protein